MPLKRRTLIIIAVIATLLGLILGIMIVTIIRLTTTGTPEESPTGSAKELTTVSINRSVLPTTYLSKVSEKDLNKVTSTEKPCYCPCSCDDVSAIEINPNVQNGGPTSPTKTDACQPQNGKEKPIEHHHTDRPDRPDEGKEEHKQKTKEGKKKHGSVDEGKPTKGKFHNGKDIVNIDEGITVGDSNEIVEDVPEAILILPKHKEEDIPESSGVVDEDTMGGRDNNEEDSDEDKDDDPNDEDDNDTQNGKKEPHEKRKKIEFKNPRKDNAMNHEEEDDAINHEEDDSRQRKHDLGSAEEVDKIQNSHDERELKKPYHKEDRFDDRYGHKGKLMDRREKQGKIFEDNDDTGPQVQDI